MTRQKNLAIALLTLAITAAYPSHAQTVQSTDKHSKRAAPTVAEAEKFLKNAEARLEKLSNTAQRAAWVYETNITDDTETISAQANELALTAAGEIGRAHV